MSAEELYRRVNDCLELADTALDWIINPTSDAPPEVMAGELRDRLADLERDLRCELLVPVAADTTEAG